MSGWNLRFGNRKEKGNPETTRGVTNKVASNLFGKSGSGGKANMANGNSDPYDKAYWGEGTGKSKFQYPYDGNKGYPTYDNGNGKGGHDQGKSNTFAAIAKKPEEQPATQQYLRRLDRPRMGPIMELECWYSSRHPSLMAIHDAFHQHENFEVIRN